MAEILGPEPTKQAFSSALAIISSRGFLWVSLGVSVNLPPHFMDEELSKAQNGKAALRRSHST